MKFPRSPKNISRGDSAREIPPWLRQVNARRRARGQCRSGGRSVASRETPSACWERTRQREARGSAPPGGKASRGRRTRKDRCLASLERAFRISGEFSRDRAEGKVAVAGAGRLAADERDKSTGDASREVEGAVGALGSASDADSSARDMGGQDAPRAWTHVKDGRDATNAARSVAHAAAASARPAWGASGPVATLVNELIDALRPTEQSDRRRRAVFQHIASLVDGCFAGENVLVRVPHAARRRQTRRARRATAIPVRSRTARVSRSSDRSFSRGDSPVPVPRTSAAPRARRSIATFHAVARARQQRQFVGQDAVSELRNFSGWSGRARPP